MEMFENQDEIIKAFSEANVVEMYVDPSYYEEKYGILKKMLNFIELYYGEKNLEAELEVNPDFDNNVFDLYGYAYYEGRQYIYKREIDEYLAILSVKMEEYNKYVVELTVNAGVSLAFLRIH